MTDLITIVVGIYTSTFFHHVKHLIRIVLLMEFNICGKWGQIKMVGVAFFLLCCQLLV